MSGVGDPLLHADEIVRAAEDGITSLVAAEAEARLGPEAEAVLRGSISPFVLTFPSPMLIKR